MVRVEGVDVRKKELDLECQALTSKVEELRIKKDEELSSLEGLAQSTKRSRAELAPKIEGELLAIYEKIRASGDGVGAAKLAGNQCLGCHLTLNAAELTRIKSLADDEVVRCEECRRILVRLD